MQAQGRRTNLILPVAFVVAVFAVAPAAGQASRPYRSTVPKGLDLFVPVPDANPLTQAKISLGRRLFFDSLLSRDETRACGTCHDPRKAFTDGRALSVGVFGRLGTRSVPTLINRVYGTSFFWDGRTSSLEHQVLRPVEDSLEMDMTVAEVVARLERDPDYPELFRTAFGRPIHGDDLARALASYVRTIVSGDAPIDRYRYDTGGDASLSDEALRGLRLFRGKASCTACHVGPSFTDEGFHNTGVAWRDGAIVDSGRFAVTGEFEDLGAFKTPTLREVARTAPYMHDGTLATLEEVIDFYDRGGNPNPYRDPSLRPLRLTEQEKRALLSLLQSLSGSIQEGR